MSIKLSRLASFPILFAIAVLAAPVQGEHPGKYPGNQLSATSAGLNFLTYVDDARYSLFDGDKHAAKSYIDAAMEIINDDSISWHYMSDGQLNGYVVIERTHESVDDFKVKEKKPPYRSEGEQIKETGHEQINDTVLLPLSKVKRLIAKSKGTFERRDYYKTMMLLKEIEGSVISKITKHGNSKDA
ncbi:YfdX family protein [Dongshaea marina]|uniref:hypothetical protein n=1 Tax=Dongshaea marina TaxID=2047966 RepID=UPI00131EFC03|nr:hypothetical protein [Dongshaea marina]